MTAEKQENLLKDFKRTVEVSGDVRTNEFSDLPSGFCSGFPYLVTIQATMPTTRDRDAVSEIVTDLFMTRPAPPSQLRPSKDILTICFSSSTSKFITEYRISCIEISDDPSAVESGDVGKEILDVVQVSDLSQKHKTISYTFSRDGITPGASYQIKVQSCTSFKSNTYSLKTSRSVPITETLSLNQTSMMWTVPSQFSEPAE